jgi:CheY-like chemotaxis protein
VDKIMTQATLAGRRMLVVEDEPLIAMLLEDMLADLEMTIAGVAESVPAALDLVETGEGIDAAILDMNLRGRSVEPVAERLAALGIPFLFASGYGADALTSKHAGAPVLPKPFRREALEEALQQVFRAEPAT